MLQANCFFPFPTSFFALFLWLLPHPLSSVQLTPTVASVYTCSASFFPLMVLPPPPFSIYAAGRAGKSGLAKRREAESRQVAAFQNSLLSVLECVRNPWIKTDHILHKLLQEGCAISICCCWGCQRPLFFSTAFHVWLSWSKIPVLSCQETLSFFPQITGASKKNPKLSCRHCTSKEFKYME